MVTQNKTWRFSKRIKNDNYNVWRKSTSQHFDLGAVISSLLKTPPLPDSDSAGHVGCIDGRGGGGVFRSAAKCSSAIHYSYNFLSA